MVGQGRKGGDRIELNPVEDARLSQYLSAFDGLISDQRTYRIFAGVIAGINGEIRRNVKSHCLTGFLRFARTCAGLREAIN
jgi:hypothetical protein